MAYTRLEIATYSPFPTLHLRLPASTPFAALSDLLAPLCPVADQNLCLFSGRSLPQGPLEHDYVHLRLGVRLRGGKGGFGTQLRAAGGRMASQKTSNKDSCRTLDGRRLTTIKEAEKLADYIKTAPQREQARKDEARKKLNALHSQIERMEADASATGSKRRLDDDDDFNEKNEEMLENVKDAVKAALLKRKKKKKLAATDVATGANAEASGSGTAHEGVATAPVVAASA